MARKTGINALHSRRLAAIDVFSKAANSLLVTASEYRTLADEAYAEAHERTELATEATKSAAAAEDQARRIRELLG